MQNASSTLLGISLGTRSCGFAIKRGEDLIDYGMKSFPSVWSALKQREILNAISLLIDRHKVEAVYLKVAHPIHSSWNLKKLEKAFREMLHTRHIPVDTLYLEDIREYCSLNDIITKYPEVYRYYRIKTNNTKYYRKMIEAVALLECPAKSRS